MICRLLCAGLLLATGLVAGGCAQPARPTAMVADVAGNTVLDAASPLRDRVAMGGVTGGRETNPLWTSQVSNEDFRRALSLSLRQHTMLSAGPGPLVLTARLVRLDQPLAGFDVTVTGSVHYQVTDSAGASVFDRTVTIPYTADFSDAFVGIKRLRLANEGAIKANIQRFLTVLIDEARADPGRFGDPALGALRLSIG